MIDEMKQLSKLKNRLGIKDVEKDELLADFLGSAKAEIMARRYPFGDFPKELDTRYANLQIEIAVVMYNKQGAEGQTSHSENGVNRGYEEYGYLLKDVTPLVGRVRK